MNHSTAQKLLNQIQAAEELGLNLLAERGRAALARYEARMVAEQDGLPIGARIAVELNGLAEEILADAAE